MFTGRAPAEFGAHQPLFGHGFSLRLAAFLTALGKTARSRREAASGGAVGAIVFTVACILVGLGLLANIISIGSAEIPMLVLAHDLSPLLASGIALMILAGIYTTAVPLLWTVSSRFFADTTPRFKCLTLTLAAVATIAGLILPFSQMVNIVLRDQWLRRPPAIGS